MKVLHHGIWLAAAVLLQVTLLNAIAVFGISPNIFLVFTVLIGFLCGRFQGMVTGMIFGLVFDLCVGRFIGTSMLSFMFIGYFSAVFSDRYYAHPPFYIFCLIAAAAALIAGVVYLVPNMLIYDAGVIKSLIRIVIPECLYNALLIIPMVPMVDKTLALCGIRKI